MTIQEILDYITKTPENANVNVLSGMLDELTSGGGGEGGGDSDFTTAEVTFINNGEGLNNFYTVCLPHTEANDLIMDTVPVRSGENAVINVPLYKGSFKINMLTAPAFNNMGSDADYSVTGGVAIDLGESEADDPFLVITGDGTFTTAGTNPIY